jgi:hypothetical protein
MTFEEARAAVSQVTFDRDLTREVATIILNAVAAERAACKALAVKHSHDTDDDGNGFITAMAIAEDIDARGTE